MMHPICISVVTIALLLIFSFEGLLADDDPALALRIIKQAHLANEGRYPSGKLHFRIWKSLTDPGKKENNFYEAIDGVSIWSGGSVRTELKRWGPSNQKVDMNAPTADEEICILDSKKFIFYNNQTNVFVSPIAGQTISSEFRITPKNYWFDFQLVTDYPAYKAFDPAHIIPDKKSVAKISVTNEGNGIIRLTRVDQDTKSSVTARYSYQNAGNLLDCSYHSATTGLKGITNLVWSKTDSGVSYPSKIERINTTQHESRTTTNTETCEVLDFQPGFKVPKSLFNLASLNVRNGTMINDQVTGKSYRIGDQPDLIIIDSLQDLIEIMRSNGFAHPER